MKPTILGCVLCACSSALLQAATLQVGPGQTYAKPCAAIAAAGPGDTILIDGTGNYSGDVCTIAQSGLILRGVNGRPHIDAAGNNAAGKGIWIIDGDNTVIENIEFSGATVPDGNGAGIRLETPNLTVRNCYFHNNQDGILTGNPGTGEILIEYSEFGFNGTGNGFTHNIYIGQAAKFTLRFSYSHDANAGQLVKTRAAENHIEYNRLTTEKGTTSYEVDIPNGGLSFVIGNLIEQGPNNQNSSIVEYLAEGSDPHNPDQRLFIVNNTIVNDFATGTFIQISSIDTVPAVVQNNVFYGPGQLITQPSAVMTTNVSGVDPLFVNGAGYDYHLQSGSPAINAGSAPGTGAGQSLNPDYEYVHPACGEVRTIVGAIDAGAYEFGGAGAQLACTPSTGTGTPALSSLTISPNTVVGGTGASATVTMTNPAPAGGISVGMSSSNGSVASTASNVLVAAGSIGVVFPVTTRTVSASTPVTLTASYGGVNKTAGITVNPLPPQYTVTITPTSVHGFDTLTVSWTAPAGRPSGDKIILVAATSSNGSAVANIITNGTTTGIATMIAPGTPGTYQARYVLSGTTTDVARSAPVTVLAPVGYSLSVPSTVQQEPPSC